MNVPIENVVMLIGAAQGALIGLIIVQKHSALYANRYLAAMMFALSAILIHMVMDDLGAYRSAYVLQPVLLSLTFVVTPLNYLYAKFLTHRSLRFGVKDCVHFIPFIVILLAVIAALSFDGLGRNVFLDHPSADQYPAFLLWFNWALIAQGIPYVFVILYRIHVYDNDIKKMYSSIENRQLLWLRNITLLAAMAWCSFAVEQTFLAFHINLSNFVISSILLAVYLFAMGYLGMLKVEVLASASAEVDRAMDEAGREHHTADSSKYEKSGLTAAAAAVYKEKILRVLEEEKLYRQSDLTLSQMAESVGMSPHNLSEVINMQLGKTFYDLINEYRIAEVKQSLLDPEKQQLKILAIAFDAGFNSKASFNTIFKQLTHTTPSAFRKQSTASAETTP